MKAWPYEVAHAARQAPFVGPDVAVVCTEVKPTVAALRRAAVLAAGLHTRIRLVVAQVVPCPLPLDCPPVCESSYARRLLSLIPDSSAEITIDLRLCRDRDAGLVTALEQQSIVVLGARKSRCMPGWLRAQDRRLAR